MVLIYCPIITALSLSTGRGVREGQNDAEDRREKEKRGINQQGTVDEGEQRGCKTLQKREPELRPNSDVYFI